MPLPTRISDAPDDLNNTSATGPLRALLHDLLGGGQSIRDAAVASNEQGPGETGNHSVTRSTYVKEAFS